MQGDGDMSQQEGVIKFDLEFRPALPLPVEELRELNAWRRILFLLGLTGQDPARYGGLAYGNVSRRRAGGFVISGTQTGGLAELGPQHYTLVRGCDPQRNRVVAEGPVPPSSEALTHAVLYQLDRRLRFVLHVHSPAIWRHAAGLGLPLTDPAVPYGTPAMAAEVARLYRDPAVRRGGVLAMGGHEDGLVAFGHNARRPGCLLLDLLARALQQPA